MTPDPTNRNTLWGSVLVAELAAGGLEAVCIAPGSRSTPLTVAFASHPEIRVFSHLDERSAAYFALGRARRTGKPTALVCTSGTAAANFHPAIMEADQARVPLVVLTADRPAELRGSGANQTVDQVKLYGDAVREYIELPEPKVEERTVRMLRTTAARLLATATGTPAGPVHCNCPFQKPLEPTSVATDVPAMFTETKAYKGRDGPFVELTPGRTLLEPPAIERLAATLADADRPLIVAGPADPPGFEVASVVGLATAVGAPILADPLSGLRFGPHVSDTDLVCGGYDAYLSADWPAPDLVVRVGATPTSKRCRHYLRDADCRQLVIDPAGEWREATFTATDLVVAEPSHVASAVSGQLESAATSQESAWCERFRTAEADHWDGTESLPETLEGAIVAETLAGAPDLATVFVSNSMPIRDADRFGQPHEGRLTVLANRGASGIDGIISTALGAGSTVAEPLVLITGDLAFYHDMNGLLALARCEQEATIVLINNDGGGIFHLLPISSYDPPFTEQFKTPHGLEFSALEGLYDLEILAVDPADFSEAYQASLQRAGTQVLEVSFDAEASHVARKRFDAS